MAIGFISPISRGRSTVFSLHVEPILIPISWLYLLYPDPLLLLILQAVVVALGAIPLFALARYKLGSEWVGLAFALIYLLNPTMQAANWLEFHPLTLAPTFLMAAFYYLVTDRPGRFALFAILAISCKEEMALLIFMMGLYALVIRRRPRFGLITMGLSLAWALLRSWASSNSLPTVISIGDAMAIWAIRPRRCCSRC